MAIAGSKELEKQGKNFKGKKHTKLQPFLKWVGGKTQILEHIFQEIPKNSDGKQQIDGDFYEVFVGGGSVFLELINKIHKNEIKVKPDFKIYVNDINKELINLYEIIKTYPHKLIDKVKQLKDGYDAIETLKKEQLDKNGKKKRTNTKDFDELTLDKVETKEEYYYVLRNEFNRLRNPKFKSSKSNKVTRKMLRDHDIQRAGLFIFINKTCFRGVYRESASGDFNVPFGNYKIMSMYNEEDIIELNKAFNNKNHEVIFMNEDFRDVCEDIEPGDLVYLDPPYFPATLKFQLNYKILNTKPINKTKDNMEILKKYWFETSYKKDAFNQPIPLPESKKVFTTYNKDSFKLKEQEQLRDICLGFKEENINFIASNSCAQWILDNYEPYFNVEKILCKRRINSKKPQDTDYEVLIH